MRSARLSLALETGALDLPPEGRIAVYRPRIGDDLSDLPRDRVVVLTGFKPDHDHFAARYSVTPEPSLCRGHRLPAPVTRGGAG
jgi:16S rRNA (guanine1207-N2)-methyltransferase